MESLAFPLGSETYDSRLRFPRALADGMAMVAEVPAAFQAESGRGTNNL